MLKAKSLGYLEGMLAVARLVLPRGGTPLLWPEDWRAARTASSRFASMQTNTEYDFSVVRCMLKRWTRATSVDQIKDIVDEAFAQNDKQQLITQYCAISAKLADSLENTVAAIFESFSLTGGTHEYAIFRSEWAMLQEAVARAMGLTVRGLAGGRLRRSGCANQVRSQIIVRLIRRGLGLIRHADIEIAWQAIKIGAGRVW